MKLHYRLLLIFLLVPWVMVAGNNQVQTSVLSTGTWYKFMVRNNGLHRIAYHDLVKMGIDPGKIDPADIRIFSNGSGMVPESNIPARTNDLREISILVNDGGDGKFDSLDYILFYGEGPDSWKRGNNNVYTHSKNLYSNVTYYYMSFDLGTGKRVTFKPTIDSAFNQTSVRWDDMVFHELDQVSVIRSGKRWFGEEFSRSKPLYNFEFSFPYIDSISPARLKTSLIGRSEVISKVTVLRDGVSIDSLSFNPISLDLQGSYADGEEKTSYLLYPNSHFSISLEYNAPTDPSRAWLDFIEIQLSRKLYWNGPEFVFRDLTSFGAGKITEFRMRKAKQGITVWDITDMSDIHELQTTIAADSILKFRLKTDTLHTFFAFDGTHYDTVSFVGTVANQNLHALQPKAMIIISPPVFTGEAQRLASFRKSHDQIDAVIVSVPEIFNEFSCGQPDPGGIRDFVKMLYDRGQGSTQPKYILLFGDGSYDPKDRTPDNDNFIPTFESIESLSTTASFVTDDYYGIMGATEGYDASGTIDIGIGRFPVNTTDQAKDVVDKIIHYNTFNDTVYSEWRNNLALVCDEGERNYFVANSEELSAITAAKYPVINVNKIYFDAYPMETIPAGSRFPEANKALNQAVEKGTMLINYIGHGGETGWSNRQVLTLADINSWTNADKLPVFVTATCEFSRFDNPEHFSAGEEIIVRPGGGGIAMFSTTRTTFAGTNQSLDTSFFRHMMERRDGGYIRMGELLMISKNNNSNNSLLKNFVLLGDPSQQMGFPDHNVITTSINGKPANQPDTAYGMSTLTISGVIQDYQGNPQNDFNGILTAKMFDKPTLYSTLGNTYGQSNGSFPQKFYLQDHLMNRVRVPVANGQFSFSFTVPKSLGLSFGSGKISYYAENGKDDAKGYTSNAIFGGRDPEVIPETNGPSIALFMDSRNFISGSMTGSNPLLIADLFDTSGVNAVGFGIGHDILGVLDDDWAHVINLNDYYDPLLGSYTRGEVNYQFTGLQAGQHKLTVRAFDLYDNSSEKEIYFLVSGGASINVQNIFCYPNPAKTITHFSFSPVNTPGGFNVTIDIFNLYGIKLRSMTESYPESGLGPILLDWDLTDGSGNKLISGIYPFTVKFTGTNGSFENTSGKIVIIH